ncbi:MAG: mannose-6-phosphate isomerase, class I [Atopostipes sp.]|nr:mannose-6-phosphate isomerase, class I [Atopostipes sp.]
MEPLFLKGTFQEKIWGGSKLETEFGYDIPSDKTGELWAISAHKNGESTVKNGQYKGMKLSELWDEHRELFGNEEGDVFPLLTKIIDAQDDLSVQVHPDDEYALEHEGELGKTECWYILSAEPGAQIIYGHHAETEEELAQMIEDGEWDDLLRYVEVEAGDFFYLPSGSIHAITSGIMILETQQSSDTTYRLYDYDRKDDDGNLRDLHIEDSIAVSTVPHVDYESSPTKKNDEKSEGMEELVSTEFFTVSKLSISNQVHFTQEAPYQLMSVIDGTGKLIINEDQYEIEKGDHFILPNGINEFNLEGHLEIIASHT